MGRTMKVIAMLATATLATQAAAQLYKGKRPDGKMDHIKRGGESRLSSADRSRRDALTQDLGSPERRRRADAMNEQQRLYNR